LVHIKKTAVTIIMSMALSYIGCGLLEENEEKKKNESSVGRSAEVPADWDGRSDWSESSFEVQDD
jgi:hypothetical protein